MPISKPNMRITDYHAYDTGDDTLNNRENKLIKLNMIFVLLFLILGFTFASSGKSADQEEQDYINAGGEIITIFENKVTDRKLQDLTKEFNDSLEVVKHIDDYALLSVKNSVDYYEVLDSLKTYPGVVEVQGNVDIEALSFSNDTYADAQWAIHNPGSYLYLTEFGKTSLASTSNIDMDVVEAWDNLKATQAAKREVVVAVIDTGVDYQHPDLANRMWINTGEIKDNGIDDDGNGYVDDYYGWDFYNNDSSVCHYVYSARLNKYIADPKDNDDHGTHVAGIISAAANNGAGIAGIAGEVNVKIMALKINGGTKGTGNLSSAIEAIKYATRMGADICNLSWGTPKYTETLKQVMKESSMLFIAAAGNTGENNDEKPIYPADLGLENLISVTFINADGKLTSQSNYGPNSVDLAAPGEDIYSTTVGNYDTLSGSSMAAPQVTGVAALMYACNDHIYASNVKEILLKSIKPLEDLRGRIRTAGIPNAYKSVLAAKDLSRDLVAPIMTFTTLYNKGDMLVPITAVDEGDSGVRVLRWSLGTKKVEDFGRGVLGTPVYDNQVTISKAGVYTFYASDYAGNEAVQVYEVKEDTTPPKIKSTYTVADNYKTRTINLRVTDFQSLVKRVEFMSGTRKATEFLPSDAGSVVELVDGKATINVKKDGTYTIFAIDYRGNMTVNHIKVKTVKATKLKLSEKGKTLSPTQEYMIPVVVTPSNTTDVITYKSSNRAVATVSEDGTVLAKAPGKAKITVRTSSGLTAVCTITVK